MSLHKTFAFLSLFFLAAACGGGSDEPVDRIEVLSVTPATTGVDQQTEFTVSFRYTLASKQAGVVNMGFFVDSQNQRLVGSSLVVSKGSGTASLSAIVTPSHYTTTSDFAVGILLSEEPHPVPWVPLVKDKQSILLVP